MLLLEMKKLEEQRLQREFGGEEMATATGSAENAVRAATRRTTQAERVSGDEMERRQIIDKLYSYPLRTYVLRVYRTELN